MENYPRDDKAIRETKAITETDSENISPGMREWFP
jgi:hypothetical protein